MCEYDSWSSVKRFTYPDFKQVDYAYNRAGDRTNAWDEESPYSYFGARYYNSNLSMNYENSSKGTTHDVEKVPNQVKYQILQELWLNKIGVGKKCNMLNVLIFSALLLIMPFSFGQQVNGEIRKGLHIFLIEIGESNSKTSRHHPTLMIADIIKEKPITKKNIYFIKNGFYRFCTLSPHCPINFLISNKHKRFIINMKRPLSEILQEVDLLFNSITFLTEQDKIKCKDVIAKTHRFNWDNCGCVRPVGMKYDPKKW